MTRKFPPKSVEKNKIIALVQATGFPLLGISLDYTPDLIVRQRSGSGAQNEAEVGAGCPVVCWPQRPAACEKSFCSCACGVHGRQRQWRVAGITPASEQSRKPFGAPSGEGVARRGGCDAGVCERCSRDTDPFRWFRGAGSGSVRPHRAPRGTCTQGTAGTLAQPATRGVCCKEGSQPDGCGAKRSPCTSYAWS